MKSVRLVLSVALISACAVAFAQSHEHKSDVAQSSTQSDAQKTFTAIKGLAGAWEGKVTTMPSNPAWEGGALDVSMRVTSRGNALVHELRDPRVPDDPTRYDHPVTMFYLDNDRLFLTHYCDAGNRPRMVAKASPDGKTFDFDFVDIAGNLKYGHMQHAKFTLIDANHHIEEWTFLMPGDKPVVARLDLQRKDAGTPGGN